MSTNNNYKVAAGVALAAGGCMYARHWMKQQHHSHLPRSFSASKFVDQEVAHPQGANRDGYSKKKIPTDLDAIVIGSGIGGLACAALMARAGKRVLVLEQVRASASAQPSRPEQHRHPNHIVGSARTSHSARYAPLTNHSLPPPFPTTALHRRRLHARVRGGGIRVRHRRALHRQHREAQEVLAPHHYVERRRRVRGAAR